MACVCIITALPLEKSGLVETLVPGPIHEGLVGASRSEKRKVMSMIHKTMPALPLTDIKKVENSFLKALYELKKEEYQSRNGFVNEMDLMHVTSASNVESIILNNFDWRRVKRGLFGLGTSFSGDVQYANGYANQNIGEERAIIITKVLVSNSRVGRKYMRKPPVGYDTAVGNGSKVFVKFNDHEYLPQFVAYYNLADTVDDSSSDYDDDSDYY